MNFKPSQDVWSIAQICDHIRNAENSIVERAKKMLESPAEPDKEIDIDERIKEVLEVISAKNRDKVKFPAARGTEPAEPAEIAWETPKEFIAEFKKLRGQSIDYVNTTQDELLIHYNPLIPRLGEMNSYLWLVFMSAHNSRHVAQIREVMSHESFPK